MKANVPQSKKEVCSSASSVGNEQKQISLLSADKRPAIAVQRKMHGILQNSPVVSKLKVTQGYILKNPCPSVKQRKVINNKVGTGVVIQRNPVPIELDAPDLSNSLTASAEDTATIRRLLALPDIRNQWEQMLQVGGPITIAATAVGSSTGHRPSWNPSTRTITVPASCTGVERESIISFELHNAFNAGGSGRNPNQPCHMTREQYAIGSEMHEYNAVVAHHEHTSQGVAHFGWDQRIDRFRGHFGDPMLSSWNTPQGYVTAMDTGRPNSHTNVYRHQWDLRSAIMDES